MLKMIILVIPAIVLFIADIVCLPIISTLEYPELCHFMLWVNAVASILYMVAPVFLLCILLCKISATNSLKSAFPKSDRFARLFGKATL